MNLSPPSEKTRLEISKVETRTCVSTVSKSPHGCRLNVCWLFRMCSSSNVQTEDRPRRSHQRGPIMPYNGKAVLEEKSESTIYLPSTVLPAAEPTEIMESEKKEESDSGLGFGSGSKDFNLQSYDSGKLNLNHEEKFED